MVEIFNKDFLEFIEALNESNTRYILVGGYSVILHGYPRTTGDLDVWVDRTPDNYKSLTVAFDLFKLPTFDMTLDNFLNPVRFDVFRFGRLPIAIDIITELKGVSFEDCWSKKETRTFQKVEVSFISYQDLLQAKEASGRPRDINDIENLKQREK